MTVQCLAACKGYCAVLRSMDQKLVLGFHLPQCFQLLMGARLLADLNLSIGRLVLQLYMAQPECSVMDFDHPLLVGSNQQ